MTADSPAVIKLRRLRRSLTLLYAAISAVCLITLAFIAAAIDAGSRAHSLDAQVAGRAEALSRAVWMDQGVLHLDPLSEDELAGASRITAVLQRAGSGPVQVRWARPSNAALPSAAELERLWASTVEEQDTFLTTMPGGDGKRARWAAAPVWNADDIGAVVIAGDDLTPEHRSHESLVQWLAVGCTGLVLASAAAGHVLSGRSMRPALRALDRQERFLAEAAHELRAPLAAVRLVMEAGFASPTRAPAAITEAVQLVDHMGRVVSGLLNRARIQAGTRRPELTPLRLDQIVEQVVEELPQNASRIVVHSAPTIVRGDPDLLAQAVRNLVENALRHGTSACEPSALPVEVHVAAGTVAVRDHGPGIAATDRERIFQDRVTGGLEGVGVGLAIVRWVAELHGGTACADQAPGGGALVQLILPEHQLPAASSSPHDPVDRLPP
ncbi:two-component system OmpR family sensor kinase [Catenulispora sp. MAP12-49]|uniref:sensor histidine kinase n=1 Tax=Catenulispora sp. MAP12-49 TaxID=3156302 RepID=UPI00351424DC